jgi:hypothetical protein
MVSAPTPYAGVNAVVRRLLPGARRVLGRQFVGLYLHGSLAYGDFRPQTSDVDFLVVTRAGLPAPIFAALQQVHRRLYTSGLSWAQRLEGAYVPQDDLRRHDPTHPPVPYLGLDGRLALEQLGSDWILQRWILREMGIAVAGPTPAILIDPVGPEELRVAVRGSLREWWSPPFASPRRFETDGYRAYAVLTMCRSLYVLEHGRIASKPEAARWALQTLAPAWHALIRAAVDWQAGSTFDTLGATFVFIRFTLQRAGILPKEKE